MTVFFMDKYPTDDDFEQFLRAFRSYEWSAYASFAVAGGMAKHFLVPVTSPRRVFDLWATPYFQAAFETYPSPCVKADKKARMN